MASIQNVVRQIVSKVIQEQRGGYGTKVREIISKLNEIPKGADESEIKRLAVNVAESMDLKYLGSGIHRVVYAIDDDHVLKIGASRSNDVESDPKVQTILGPFATKVYYRGPYAVWVIAERVRTASNIYDWWSDAGVPKFDRTSTNLNYFNYPEAISAPEHIRNTVGDDKVAEDFIMHIVNSDIGRRLLRIHNETNVFVADLQDVNVGYGSDGRPVILDLGHAKGFHDVKESRSIREQRGGYGTKVREVIAQLTDKNSEYYANPERLAIKLGLKKLGQGIHRRAYAIDDDHVLKIGDGESLPNDVESDPKAQAILGPFAVRVYYRGPYASWIIVEAVETCRKLGKEPTDWWFDAGIKQIGKLSAMAKIRFANELVSLVNHYDTYRGLNTTDPLESDYPFGDEETYTAIKQGRPVWLSQNQFSSEVLDDVMHSDIMRRLIKLSQETDIEVDDLHASNLGYAPDGRPVILDLGMAKNNREVSESKSIREQRGGYGSKVREVIEKLTTRDHNGLYPHAKTIAMELGLRKIGAGMDRIVYAIDDDHVLKTGANEPNDVESSPQVQSILGPFAAKVYYRGPYAGWVIVERVKTCNDLDKSEPNWWADAGIKIPDGLGITFARDLAWIAHYYGLGKNGPLPTRNLHTPQSHHEYLYEAINSDIMRRLIKLSQETNVEIGDLHTGNLGYGSDGRPVILDLGNAKKSYDVLESLKLIDESFGSKADFIIRKLRNVEKAGIPFGYDDLQMALERAAKELSKQGYLKSIGTSTRTVWRIVGEDLVLKIMGEEYDLSDDHDEGGAFNYHQNKFEASPQLQQIMGPYLPKTIARGRHHRWIISELVKPITPHELDNWAAAASLPEELVFKGKIWLDVFYEMMRKHYAVDSFDFEEELAVYNIHLNQSDIEPMEQNDLFMRLVRAHNEVGVSLGDLKWQNLGWSLDDGRPVILDLGA